MDGTGRQKNLRSTNILNRNNMRRNIPAQVASWQQIPLISESAESQWLWVRGDTWGMLTWPHLGGTEVTPILGIRWGRRHSNLLTEDQKQQPGFQNKPRIIWVCFWWLKMSLGLNFGRKIFGSDANRKRKVCVCVCVSGSVVGDRYGSENEPNEREHLWVGEQSSRGLC